MFAQHGDAYGAAVDPALLTRLDLKTGDRITIGDLAVEVRAALTNEPDKLAGGGIGLGPRVLLSEAALRASGLLQPGSLVRWQYRLRLPDNDASDSAVAALEKQAKTAFPDAGWEIRTRNKASPQLERNVERFSEFLTLVALTTLLVGGVGVANAVASHLARKRDVIGTMKALGATGGRRLCDLLRRSVAHRAVRRADRRRARRAAAVRAGVGFRQHHSAARRAFAASGRAGGGDRLWLAHGARFRAVAARPRARRAVSMLFRDQVAAERRWPRRRYIVATVLIVAALAALAIFSTYDRRLGAIFIASRPAFS